MKLIQSLILFWLSFTSSVYAAGEPLVVGVESFAPPFVMQGGHQEIYGFDIDMINSLCAIMERTCQFRIMRFNQLIPALINHEIDVAVSAITITAERSKEVYFSAPYAISNSRFMARLQPNPPAFNLGLFKGKTIGVESGTIFNRQIQSLGINNASIKEYSRFENLLEGLSNNEVDYILVDDPTAIFWAANSGILMTVGPALQYGYGFGIAVQPNNTVLLDSINKSLQQYLTSPAYKQNFDKYLATF